jgi:putative ABC transport system permease protein
MAQVRGIIDRMVGALEFIFGFTLAAGLVVMLAVIEASRAQRARETALLRTLGASSKVILQGLLAEYAVLGLLAGSVAAIAAQIMAWVLAVQVFDMPYGPRPLLWVAGALAGCGIVTLVGWLSLRGVLRTPPRQVLVG